jgi:hypothetical protein
MAKRGRKPRSYERPVVEQSVAITCAGARATLRAGRHSPLKDLGASTPLLLGGKPQYLATQRGRP